MSKIRMVSNMNMPLRAFSAEYTTVNQEKWYTPHREPQFNGSTMTVFNGEDCSERTFVPFGVKEAASKLHGAWELSTCGTWLSQWEPCTQSFK